MKLRELKELLIEFLMGKGIDREEAEEWATEYFEAVMEELE